MPENHYVIAALPSGSAKPNKALLRAGLVSRNAYCLAPNEDSQDLVVIDPDGGGTVPAIIQNGHLYSLDDADTTTAHDGVVCLVSNDNKRYKLDDLSLPYSVLTKGLTAPPVSLVLGDTYLIYGNPTGVWAGHAGEIPIWTARGWAFCVPPIGFKLYVEDEDAYYYKDVNGDWLPGLGSVLFGADTVPLSAIIGCAGSLTIRILNQTTNSPPVSWSKGAAYVIGPSPTGPWAGRAGDVAIAESDGAHAEGDEFTIYAAANGDEVFDISLALRIRFDGTDWFSVAGDVVGSGSNLTTSTHNPSPVGTSGTSYTYSQTNAPGSSIHVIDPTTISVRARRAGARIEIEWEGTVTWLTKSQSTTIALKRDNEAVALAWWPIYGTDLEQYVKRKFIITAPDDQPHDYKIAHYRPDNSQDVLGFRRREISYKVFA